MRSVFMMSIANIRKRKAQSILIGLTLMMASLLLATAIGMLEGSRDPVSQMFEEQQGSHITMMMPEPVYNTDDIVAWWESRSEVEGVEHFPYYMVEDDFIHNGKKQSMGGIMFTQHPTKSLLQDQLRIAEGEVKEYPGKGELWVPTGYAYNWGLKIGDTLEVSFDGGYRQFTIGAIVVDPQFSPGIMNPVRAWVAEDFFKEEGRDPATLGSLIGVRLFDDSQYNRLWQDFEEHLGTPYIGFVFEHEFIKNAYSMVQNILAVIMLAFAAIIIVVSMFVLSFTITNAVMADYKIIGILKAQGFSSRNVKWIYSLQYFLLAILAAPLGITVSYYALRLVMAQMSRSLGIAQLDISMLLPAALTGGVVLAATVIFSRLASAKAGKIKPAEAIRNAAPTPRLPAEKQLKLGSFIALPVSLMLAVKSVFSGRRHSGFLFASALILAFVLAFSVNTFHSVKNMDQNYAYWGFDDADVYLSPDSNTEELSRKEMMAFLYGDDRVQAALPYQLITNAAIPAQGGQSSKNIIGFMYGGDMDSIGILNLTGENPRRSNEVAISYMAAQKYDKAVGDQIELYLNGQKDSFLVTGIYQCMNAMGWGIKLQEEAVRNVDPNAYAGNYSIKLHNEKDTAAFVEDMKELLGNGYTIRAVSESGEINLSEITGNIALVTALLSVIFMVVAFIIIFNTTIMEIHSDKKSLGIYSSIGMTPIQIRATVLWKALALSAVGMLLGIALALMVSSHILSILIRNLGMAEFPLDVTIPGTLLMMPICIAVIAVSAWLPSGKILSFSPRELVMD